LEVTPVWSLNALWGIDDVPAAAVVPLGSVVVVDEELVELHAAPTMATARTIPSAADRRFPETERKAPPCGRMHERAPRQQGRAGTNM
jgi:hypothetical protein